MATDYSWFEETLGVAKRYRCYRTGYWQYISALRSPTVEETFVPLRSWFRILRETRLYVEIEGCHSMNPPCVDGAAEIEKEMRVVLPPDVHDFYRRWGGGFLMLSDFHYVLSPQEVVSIARMFREMHLSTATECRLIRYCDVGNGNYISLRNSGGGAWDVIYVSCDFSEDDILSKAVGPMHVVAESFVEWLRQLIATDGRSDVLDLLECERLR